MLAYLKKPVRIAACRLGRCREFHHEIAVKLPERNERVVAVTAGWSSVFARRSIRGANRTVLFEDALNSGVWSLQGEWSAGKWNGRVQGFLGADDQGAWLDLSRVLKGGDGLSYGLAMHAGMTHSDWLDAGPGSVPANRTAYRAGIGPSVMVQGDHRQLAVRDLHRRRGDPPDREHPALGQREPDLRPAPGHDHRREDLRLRRRGDRRPAARRARAAHRRRSACSTTSRSTSGSAATGSPGPTTTRPRTCGPRRPGSFWEGSTSITW